MSAVELKASFLLALANDKRLLILERLLDKETSVGELADHVGLAQSALSQHLAKLRAAGLVTTRRQAQTIFYITKDDSVRRILALLEDIFEPVADKSKLSA